MKTTREKVKELFDQGLTRAEIARQLGVSKPTITFHCTNLGIPPEEQCAKRYDWAEVQRYYDEGRTIRQCIEHFGFSSESWNAARIRGDLKTRPAAIPLQELLVAGPKRNRHHLKYRLLREGVKENRCEKCGLTSWRGKPLTMALHHINGDGRDNRLENLQFLCPNCHAQTDNFSGRNKNRHLRLVNPEGQDETEAA